MEGTLYICIRREAVSSEAYADMTEIRNVAQPRNARIHPGLMTSEGMLERTRATTAHIPATCRLICHAPGGGMPTAQVLCGTYRCTWTLASSRPSQAPDNAQPPPPHGIVFAYSHSGSIRSVPDRAAWIVRGPASIR